MRERGGRLVRVDVLNSSTLRCDGSVDAVLARLRVAALDWRDSARPEELRGPIVAPVTFTSIGADGFRIVAPVIGSRYFDIAATGNVTETDGQTLIRYRLEMVPGLGRTVLQVWGFFFAVSLVLSIIWGHWRNLLLIPTIATPMILIPSYVAATDVAGGHHRALRTIITRAAARGTAA